MPNGNIVNTNGDVIGAHKGIVHYTVGQRKGLGLSGGPFFITKIDVNKNEIIVSDRKDVKNNVIYLKNVKFTNGIFTGNCLVKIRSSGNKIKGKLYIGNNNEWFCKLLEAEYGATSGQHCVFFEKNKIIGGGEILKTE